MDFATTKKRTEREISLLRVLIVLSHLFFDLNFFIDLSGLEFVTLEAGIGRGGGRAGGNVARADFAFVVVYLVFEAFEVDFRFGRVIGVRHFTMASNSL